MIKVFVENNFNLVLSLSVVIGLLTPALGHLPESSAIILISLAIFFSCSRVTVDELRHIDFKAALSFYVVRFVIVPIPIYYAALYLLPDYALGILLLAMAPVAASATAYAMVIKANPSLSLSATVITNALVPLSLPFVFYILGLGDDIHIDIFELFFTLSIAIFIPALSYFLLVRRIKPAKLYMRSNAKFYSTIFVAGMMAIVTSMQRDFILGNPLYVLLLGGIGCALFFLFFVIGFVFSRGMNFVDRKTYMSCSGINNTGLVVGLAFLYFSQETALFIVIAEIPWTMALIGMKFYVDKYDK